MDTDNTTTGLWLLAGLGCALGLTGVAIGLNAHARVRVVDTALRGIPGLNRRYLGARDNAYDEIRYADARSADPNRELWDGAN